MSTSMIVIERIAEMRTLLEKGEAKSVAAKLKELAVTDQATSLDQLMRDPTSQWARRVDAVIAELSDDAGRLVVASMSDAAVAQLIMLQENMPTAVAVYIEPDRLAAVLARSPAFNHWSQRFQISRLSGIVSTLIEAGPEQMHALTEAFGPELYALLVVADAERPREREFENEARHDPEVFRGFGKPSDSLLSVEDLDVPEEIQDILETLQEHDDKSFHHAVDVYLRWRQDPDRDVTLHRLRDHFVQRLCDVFREASKRKQDVRVRDAMKGML